MKISKLFHWLYAFLMFLPIVLFIPNAFYYGFNEHATAQERIEQEPIYYDSNEVNSFSDIHIGSIYQYTDNFVIDSTTQNKTYGFIKYLDVYQHINSNFDSTQNLMLYSGANNLAIRQTINGVQISSPINNLTLPMVFEEIYNDVNLIYTHFELYTGNYVKEYQPVLYSMSISDSMYQAWQSTWNLPLLQWTHTSFVAQPFTYISGLFGVPSDSTLNYVFAYFVSISICWLVFDVIMYLPNLAHRWLDRGALE